MLEPSLAPGETVISNQPGFATIDRIAQAGSPQLVVAVAALIAASLLAFSFLPREAAAGLVTCLAGLLVIIGIFALFAITSGILQFSGRAANSGITKAICDGTPDGLIVTDADGRILYVNDAYLRMAGAQEPMDLRTVERLFCGASDVSEAVYRLSQAARDGKSRAEELRLYPPHSGGGVACWYRIKVRPVTCAGARRASLWSVADVTRERDRQENVFQELQHVIDFLDHAPAGFFASDQAATFPT